MAFYFLSCIFSLQNDMVKFVLVWNQIKILFIFYYGLGLVFSFAQAAAAAQAGASVIQIFVGRLRVMIWLLTNNEV